MENSWKTGFLAVFAVSGSVVFLSMQAHKRLVSNFMKQMEYEIKRQSTETVMDEPKKKVRFADDPLQFTAEKTCSQKYYSSSSYRNEKLETVPENWQVMYRGILQYRNLKRV